MAVLCNEKNVNCCGWKACNCCDGCCWTEGCNCRCGLSVFFLGIVVFLAACAFYVLGFCFNIFGFDLNGPESWWHGLNVFFFELSVIITVIGLFYELISKGEMCGLNKKSLLLPNMTDGSTTKEATKAFLTAKNDEDYQDKRKQMIEAKAAADKTAAAQAKAFAAAALQEAGLTPGSARFAYFLQQDLQAASAREPKFLTVESNDQVPTQYVMLPAGP